MANVLVGDKECPLEDICRIFYRSPMKEIIMSIENWTCLAAALGLRKLVNELKQDLLLSKKSHSDIIDELIINWRSQVGSQATTGSLLEIIHTNFQWKEVTQHLQKIIQKNAIVWEDLDNYSKRDILDYKVAINGQIQPLEHYLTLMSKNKFEDIINKHLRYLLQFKAQEEILELHEYERSPNPPLYIDRLLTFHNQLNHSILTEKCNDIFVIKGIGYHQLAKLVEPEQICISGSLHDNLSGQFIILQFDDEYEEIKNSTSYPVHNIRFLDNILYWEGTTGSQLLIRKFLTENIAQITDKQLITDTPFVKRTQPILILGPQGSGKSTMMAYLANQIKSTDPEKYIIFLSLHNFCQKLNSHNTPSDSKFFHDFLASSFSPHLLTQDFLKEILINDEIHFEIFIDAFDDIPFDSIEAAEILLDHLIKSKNIRLYVTSGPCYRDMLESKLGVVSYNISDFSFEDQINYLCTAWKQNPKILNKSKITTFASKAIKSLEILDPESSLIGKPLQSFMLCKIYSIDVRHFCNQENWGFRCPYSPQTLCALYNRFMEIQFNLSNDKPLRCYLWLQALKYIYPEANSSVDKVKQLLSRKIGKSQETITEKNLNLGILRIDQDTSKPVFEHNTFADHFLAEFVVEFLITKPAGETVINELQLLMSREGNVFADYALRELWTLKNESSATSLGDNSGNTNRCLDSTELDEIPFEGLKQIIRKLLRNNVVKDEPNINEIRQTFKIQYSQTAEAILGPSPDGTNVYKGTFGDQDVAVKAINNIKDKLEIQKELKMLVSCEENSNILRYIAFEDYLNGYLMAIELCLSPNLANWIENSLPCEVEKMEILKQTTEGLSFLHKNNIIHWNLKPSNILLRTKDTNLLVKLSDFGIRERVFQRRKSQTLTSFGGCYGWAAAEILHIRELIDDNKLPNMAELAKLTKMVDIFSIGCIFYFVLTKGNHPFGRDPKLHDYFITEGETQFDRANDNLILECNLPLITSMVSAISDVRPNTEKILSHPIFD